MSHGSVVLKSSRDRLILHLKTNTQLIKDVNVIAFVKYLVLLKCRGINEELKIFGLGLGHRFTSSFTAGYGVPCMLPCKPLTFPLHDDEDVEC